jgi:hypothetical protein
MIKSSKRIGQELLLMQRTIHTKLFFSLQQRDVAVGAYQ